MQKNIFPTLILCAIFASFGATECSKAPLTAQKQIEKETEKKKKANTTLKMTELNALTSKDYTLQVGEKVYFQIDVHASVGMGGQYENTDETVVKLFGEEYNFKQKQVAGMTGGDAATKVFTFEAIKIGQVKLTFQKNFRGKIEETTEFNITVK